MSVEPSMDSSPSPDSQEDQRVEALHTQQKHTAYWRTNLTIVGVLLAIWAAVSYGAGLVFAPALNAFKLPGTQFPLGFWFAQQGAIYVFVVIIFAYVVIMATIEKRSGLDG